MGTFRLFTGEDAQSHIEAVDLSKKPEWTSSLNATSISFTENPAGKFLDWHPAPRRQFVIVISGRLEIGLGDGSKHVFGPGDARLVEDTSGQGHTTAYSGDEPCVVATIPLADQ